MPSHNGTCLYQQPEVPDGSLLPEMGGSRKLGTPTSLDRSQSASVHGFWRDFTLRKVKGVARVLVSASSECFADLSFSDMLERLEYLQFTAFELSIRESGGHLQPSWIHSNLETAIDQCRATRRLTLSSLSVEIDATGDQFYAQFESICKLAKAAKVVPLVIRSSELGTPFNEEVERLRELVRIASLEGVLVAMRTETGRMSEDPDTIQVLCDNVKGLGITLDPSHYIYGDRGVGYDQILKYVYHVRLRDTSKTQLQVRVGQGEIEYGRLVNQLTQAGYDRNLCVHILPVEDVDHDGELRKLRLLLESLL